MAAKKQPRQKPAALVAKPLAARGDRIIAKAALMRQERDMTKVAHQAIRRYLQVVRRAVAHTAIRAAGPLPIGQDPDDESDLGDDVDLNGLDQSAAWPAILKSTILPQIDSIITGLGPQTTLRPTAVTAVNAWRAEWLQQRTVALAGVPDTITRQIRDAVQAETEEKGPNPSNAARIVKDLLNPDAPTWKSRAQTIARTEVVAANNQGGLATYTAIHHSIAAQGGQVFKTWLATEDSLTRPDHADIDGTEVGIHDTFNVGESVMNGPGDDSADPGETINCRCTLTYRIDDGAGGDEGDVDADEADDADAAPDDDQSDDLTAAVEAPVTAPAIDAPPQPSDGTPSEAAATSPAGAMQWEGVLAELDAVSGDNRMIASKGLVIRSLPLPLSYQAEGSHGGEEAGKTIIVGRILTCEIRGGQLWATGDFFDAMYDVAPQAAIQQVAGGIGNVSVNLAVTVMSYMAPGPGGTMIPIDPMQYVGDYESIVEVAEESEMAGACIVDFPAFGGARITIVADPSAPNLSAVTADAATPAEPILTSEDITLPDGTVLKVGDQVNVANPDSDELTPGLIESIDPTSGTVTIAVEDPDNPGQTNTVTVDASSLQPLQSMSNESDAASGSASGAPTAPPALTAALAFPGLAEEHVYPAEWFEPVALDGPTRLTITEDGRVYGHVAEKGTCHIGFADKCVAPPSSPSGYGYFHVGQAKTTAGMLPVGKLTVGGGHADIHAGWRAAIEHYDNAGAAVAVVRAHEDDFGIQVTGALVATATGDQIAALRRNHLSGDWRNIGGVREMVAAHSINTGGFPLTPRAALAASGEPEALVAAGIVWGPPAAAEPLQAGLTLPSGVTIPASDIAVLAAAFADVVDQRAKVEIAQNIRVNEAAALRRQLESRALRSRLSVVR